MSTRKQINTLRELQGDIKLDILSCLEFGYGNIESFELLNSSLAKFVSIVLDKPKRLGLPSWLTEIREAHLAAKEYFERLRPLSDYIETFRSKGLYFGISFLDNMGLEEIISCIGESEAYLEEKMILAFERHQKAIEERIWQCSPARQAIIKEVFSLCSSGYFHGCITLALSQADGLCKEFFFIEKDGVRKPVGFYDMEQSTEHRRKQKLAGVVSQRQGAVLDLLQKQLADIDRNSSQVLEGNTTHLTGLNRHAILHGESTTFGTKANAVKAILMLDYIVDLRLFEKYTKELMATQE